MRNKIKKVHIGDVFTRLRVIEKGPKLLHGKSSWKCLCDCGVETTVAQTALVHKQTKSCGCLHRELVTDNLIGKAFGFWTVTDKATRKARDGRLYWKCICICGTEKEISSETLKNGSSTSCGCSRKRKICPFGHDTLAWGRAKDGMCKACLKNRNLKRNYGISLEDFFALYEFQNGKCAICGDELEDLRPGSPGWNKGVRVEVDHEHDNTKPKRETVRGLLCGGRWMGCNRKLGHLDNFTWLRSASNYIENPPARAFLKERLK